MTSDGNCFKGKPPVCTRTERVGAPVSPGVSSSPKGLLNMVSPCECQGLSIQKKCSVYHIIYHNKLKKKSLVVRQMSNSVEVQKCMLTKNEFIGYPVHAIHCEQCLALIASFNLQIINPTSQKRKLRLREIRQPFKAAQP